MEGVAQDVAEGREKAGVVGGVGFACEKRAASPHWAVEGVRKV